MSDAAEAADQLGLEIEFEQAKHLRVAVLLDDIDVLVLLDELVNLASERISAQPQVVDFDAVFIPDEPKVVGQLLPTFAYRDIDKVKFLGISTWDSPELLKRAAKFVEGSVFVDGLFADSESVPTQTFITRFMRNTGVAPTTIEAIAYDAGLAVESALRDLDPGTVSRSEIKDRLRTVSDLPGATGMITYHDGEYSRSLTLLTVKDGKITELK